VIFSRGTPRLAAVVNQAGAQGMPRKTGSVAPEAPGGVLDHLGHDARREPGVDLCPAPEQVPETH